MLMRLVKALNPNIFFINFLKSHLVNYLVPKNLNLIWNFGFLLALLFVLQVISGFLIIYIYHPVKISSFESVSNISVELNVGWFIRLYHSLGVSAYFFVMFIHVVKGIWYSSKVIPWSWYSGVFLLGASIAIAFMGYMLPNGQMSFWGATVIFNLLGLLGDGKALIFGGFTVDAITLKRFYVWHCYFPLAVFFVMLAHMYYLHRNSSTNPLPIAEAMEALKFFPTSMFSDVRLLIVLSAFIIFQLGTGLIHIFQSDPDNSIVSDALVTPSHIVPEWYLLLFYATLKVFPTKLTGLAAVIIVFELIVLLTESRAFTSIFTSSNFFRTWAIAAVVVVPFLFSVSYVGKMVISLGLAAIGIALICFIGDHINKLLESAMMRIQSQAQ